MLNVVELSHFDADELSRYIAADQAVIYRGLVRDWPAVSRGSPEDFQAVCPGVEMEVKYFEHQGIRTEKTNMNDYVETFNAVKKGVSAQAIPYCHDIPIFLQAPQLLSDIGDFPQALLPLFYRQQWWTFAQFFMSPAGAVTPLHFDTLRTNNAFFQIKGSKRFTLIPWQQRVLCGRRGWRWFDFDPLNEKHRADDTFDSVSMTCVDIHGGDLLVMPPGMLHHVTTLTDSISFNLDFHTQKSAMCSFKSIHEKMPKQSIYYNWLSMLGLFGVIKYDWFFDKYRPYLNYVS